MQIWLLVLGINAVVWLLIFAAFGHQRKKLAKSLTNAPAFADERLLLGPQNGYSAKTKSSVSIRSMGVAALTDKRLIFRSMLGMGFEIPIEDVAAVSEAVWFQGMYRNGKEFLILKLRDGREIGFQFKNHQEWIDEIERRITTPPRS